MYHHLRLLDFWLAGCSVSGVGCVTMTSAGGSKCPGTSGGVYAGGAMPESEGSSSSSSPSSSFNYKSGIYTKNWMLSACLGLTGGESWWKWSFWSLQNFSSPQERVAHHPTGILLQWQMGKGPFDHHTHPPTIHRLLYEASKNRSQSSAKFKQYLNSHGINALNLQYW